MTFFTLPGLRVSPLKGPAGCRLVVLGGLSPGYHVCVSWTGAFLSGMLIGMLLNVGEMSSPSHLIKGRHELPWVSVPLSMALGASMG